MIRRTFRAAFPMLFILLLVSTAADSAPAQHPESDSLKNEAPCVFIDCRVCDMDYFRTEITFVNYVRDRKDAQVHVLITTQSTGSGGTEYTLTFSGREQFEGNDTVLRYVAAQTDTPDETRSGLAGILKIGLVSYAGKTPVAKRIRISFQDKANPTSVEDSWNFWVFSLSGSGYFNGEKLSRCYSLYGSFSANRITPAFKFRTSYTASRSLDRFSLNEGTLISTSKSHNFYLLGVKSISDHWSAGAGLTAYSSTYSNIKFGLKPAPAIEYNFFPYSESTRRQLRVLWKPGYNSYRYRE